MTEKNLFLNAGADRRLRGGHQWIYSNEVDVRRSPLNGFAPGEQIVVCASNGKPMGSAFVNPHALICGRLISRDAEVRMTAKLLERRLQQAMSLRERLYPDACYRLAFGDSDGLPGLVVDRFGEVCVAQISSAGMEALREQVGVALRRVTGCRMLVFKNDGKMREVEGLPCYVEADAGAVPDFIELIENGVRFQAPLASGQKTGWFYDHRDNRARLRPWVAGKRVLDVFSYVGGWGVQAAQFGAAEVVMVDSSASALDWVARNAALNGVAGQVSCMQGDAFEVMKSLCDAQERFDVVIVDPPALIPRRRDIKVGEAAYARLNQLALRLLNPTEGLLVSASCSMHLQRDQHIDLVRAAGRKIDRFVQVVAQGHQAADHPIVPAIPETDYIKSLFVRAVMRF